jgi:hypothetical protein
MSTEPATPNNGHGNNGTPPSYTDQPNWASYNRVAVIAAIVGWTLFVLAGIANLGTAEDEHTKHDAIARFMVGYLSGYIYWASLPLGAMALLMIRYLAKTSWGLLLTRPLEAATRTLPLTVLLFIPLAAAVALIDPDTHEAHYSPYWWSRPHHTEPHDLDPTALQAENKRDLAELKGKEMANRAIAFQRAIDEAHAAEMERINAGRNHFLSAPAFIGVGAALFIIWGIMIYFLNKWGKAASDADDPRVVDRYLEKLSNISGPGLIIYAITTTAAATQWVMSTEPGWASTMFPVIYAVNQFLTAYAFCLALFLLWTHRPPFVGFMRPKFQLDMGTLLLAFTLFWSYTSFSQFMLVWIGNLPEEIPFYLKRSNSEGHRTFWWGVSAALIALHFALPFLLLLFRDIKLHPARLRAVAAYLVVVCMIDVIWWIAPSAPEHGHFPTWLIDIGAVLGIGGIWGLYFIYQLRQRPLFPDNQAFLLPEGHHHEQH